jgi:hypothetical protein
MSLPSKAEYERLIYSLLDAHPEVAASTLRLYSASALTAIVEGRVHLRNGLELRVLEVLNFKSQRIQRYSYTVLRGEERVRWYDSEPHLENPDLAVTFPHHRHEPPDIKHHRRPAPGISFTSPNLETLLADCIQLGAQLG